MRNRRRNRQRGIKGFETLEPRIVLSISIGALETMFSDPRIARFTSRANASFVSRLSNAQDTPTIETAPTVPQEPVDPPNAFPGAAGFGAQSEGGRGGDVYHVTTLNDWGPGSLREGIESATGPRTIVFELSGTIELESVFIIDKPNITIAGQTAPGDGITLRNFGTTIINTNDTIIRYVRFRPGDTVEAEHDSLLIYNSHDVIIDHVSASWGVDETVDVGSSLHVTVQNSIISEGLQDSHHSKGPHSAGLINIGSTLSVHHNLFAHNDWRSPMVRQQVDIVNNVIYDWGSHGSVAGWTGGGPDPFGPTQVNLEGNYYIAGPSAVNAWLAYLGHRESELWFSGNFYDRNQNGVLDGQLLTDVTGWAEETDVRFDFPSVPSQDALAAYDLVLSEAGASLFRDAVDVRIIDDVLNQTGSIIDSQNEVGGWPLLYSQQAPVDGDRDGMSDAWERENGLDPNDPHDGNEDANRNGYTDLEDYLHYLTQPNASDNNPGPNSGGGGSTPNEDSPGSSGPTGDSNPTGGTGDPNPTGGAGGSNPTDEGTPPPDSTTTPPDSSSPGSDPPGSPSGPDLIPTGPVDDDSTSSDGEDDGSGDGNEEPTSGQEGSTDDTSSTDPPPSSTADRPQRLEFGSRQTMRNRYLLNRSRS